MNINLNTEPNISSTRKCYKDVFHAFMVKGAEFDGYFDIPFIPAQSLDDVQIKRLISYRQANNHLYEFGDIVHFYLDDYKFDGLKGMWASLTNQISFKRGFNLEKIQNATAIIAPDFSLYLDMPRCMQIWNVYRSRAIGYYLSTLGYKIIPNVRWTDVESYKFCFDGIKKNQIVAVGTLGCSKGKYDKQLLLNGFIEMIKRLNPSAVILYGPVIKELDTLIKKFHLNTIHFESETQAYFGGHVYGDEK